MSQHMRKLNSVIVSSVLAAATLAALSSSPAHGDETATSVSSPSASPTSSSAPKNSNGVYFVGDIGPGGGFIFYVNKKGFNCGPNYTNTGSPTGGLCHYLEVAPSGWSNVKPGSRDPYLNWATESNRFKAVKGLKSVDDVCLGSNFKGVPSCLASSGVGNGYKNSIAIVKQGNDINTAAGAARAYRGGSLSDWYLPTLAELNNLLKWGKGLPWKSDTTVLGCGTVNSPTYGAETAGLDSYAYHSSTERYRSGDGQQKGVSLNPKYRSSAVWIIENRVSCVQEAISGSEKRGITNVRPIRAF
jgi:hypothetical protein